MLELRLPARIAALDATQEPALKAAPLWLRVIAGVVFLPGFWVSVVFAVVAVLPGAMSPRFQVPVQLACLVPGGALAWLAVRRAPARLLALLIPVLLALYFIAIYLVAALLGQG